MSAAAFLEVFLRQQGRYRELRGLLEGQAKVLEGGDLDALLVLVERKRALLAEIEAMESELAPIKSRWPELREGLSPGERKAIEAAVGETRRLLADIVKFEDEGRALMERQRGAPPADTAALMMKHRARGAYGVG